MDWLSVEMAKVAHNVLSVCMGVKPNETVVIVTDHLVSPRIPMQLASQAHALGAKPVIITMPQPARNGEDPPQAVTEAVRSADVVLAPTTTSIYHTAAKLAVEEAGGRGALKVIHDERYWIKGGMTANFPEIRKVAEKLAERMRRTKQVRVTTPAGTDITMTIKGREPKAWLTGICRNPGEISALPGGEVSLPPIEGTTNGVAVIELAMTSVGAVVEPIRLTIEDGYVTKIEGGVEARKLESIIEGVENATNIAEIGFGLNPASLLVPEIYESKKALGTAHLGIGDNAWGYGGHVKSDIHLDGMLLDVKVEFDGELVIDGKRLLFMEGDSGVN